MSIQEMLGKLVGLDPSKQYNIVEESSTVEQNPEQTPEQTQPQPQQPQVQTPSLEELSKQITQLSERNKTLEAANTALLNHISVQQEPEKPLEEKLYDFLVKGDTNYGNAYNRTESGSPADLSNRQ